MKVLALIEHREQFGNNLDVTKNVYRSWRVGSDGNHRVILGDFDGRGDVEVRRGEVRFTDIVGGEESIC